MLDKKGKEKTFAPITKAMITAAVQKLLISIQSLNRGKITRDRGWIICLAKTS